MFEYFSCTRRRTTDRPQSFGDGQVIGARLDRLGLRPFAHRRDGRLPVRVLRGRSIDFDPARVIARGRVSAGGMVYYDHREHRTYRTEEVYQKLAAQADYPALLAAAKVDLADLPVADLRRLLRRRSRRVRVERPSAVSRVPPRPGELPLLHGPDARLRRRTGVSDGARVGGQRLTNRRPASPASSPSASLQVTNPPLDGIREADGMSLRWHSGFVLQVFASARERRHDSR